MKYQYNEINARLQEQMRSVLGSIAAEDKGQFDFSLEVGVLPPMLDTIGTMVLSQEPALESMRILRCLLDQLRRCEQVNGQDSGESLTIGFAIQSVANWLPEPLSDFWSAELEAASHVDNALLAGVQRGHDEMLLRAIEKR